MFSNTTFNAMHKLFLRASSVCPAISFLLNFPLIRDFADMSSSFDDCRQSFPFGGVFPVSPKMLSSSEEGLPWSL